MEADERMIFRLRLEMVFAALVLGATIFYPSDIIWLPLIPLLCVVVLGTFETVLSSQVQLSKLRGIDKEK